MNGYFIYNFDGMYMIWYNTSNYLNTFYTVRIFELPFERGRFILSKLNRKEEMRDNPFERHFYSSV